jgi:hypothetical protein
VKGKIYKKTSSKHEGLIINPLSPHYHESLYYHISGIKNVSEINYSPSPHTTVGRGLG